MRKTRNVTMNGAKRKRKTQEPITAQEALAILESAVSYCQSAGLQVGAVNGDNGTLGLFIPNAYYILLDAKRDTRAAFRLGVMARNGTSVMVGEGIKQ